MWIRRKEEEEAPRPVVTPTPPAPVEPKKEASPMSTMPGRSYEVESQSQRGVAVIGKSVIIKGQIISREDLTIDGEVEGTVEAQEHRLTIGTNGKVQAGVKAREVVVLGSINGNVEAADKIDIRKDAKLVGDIKTARIVIEDGAFFKGSIDIIRPEVTKPAAQAPRAPQPAPVANAAPAPAAPKPAPAASGASVTDTRR
ncbi:MAG: polymer-forming cytoskeletal protein [Bryobacterales bacterium]|nr:polymer-forming cytoskeletal protein [Bryobacterales bacterium]